MSSRALWFPINGSGNECPFTDQELEEFDDIAQQVIARGSILRRVVGCYETTFTPMASGCGDEPRCVIHAVCGKIGHGLTVPKHPECMKAIFRETLPSAN